MKIIIKAGNETERKKLMEYKNVVHSIITRFRKNFNKVPSTVHFPYSIVFKSIRTYNTRIKRTLTYGIAGFNVIEGYYIGINLSIVSMLDRKDTMIDTILHEISHIVEIILYGKATHSKRFHIIHEKAKEYYKELYH